MTGDQWIGMMLLASVAVSEARARLSVYRTVADSPSVTVRCPPSSAAAGLDAMPSAAALPPRDTA